MECSAKAKQLDIKQFRDENGECLETLSKYWTTANYLSVGQLYLKENFLLRDKFTADNIKDRLLGHWGTCPGINLVYAHCNNLIKKHDLDMFLVVGPGHGAPAVYANLYLEGSLHNFYEMYDNTYGGLERLMKYFSWPGGLPSHTNGQVPGCIHEGGELGYSLLHSFGAVMDNPDLIVTCIVGDGEAETGPTATSWHSYKFLDPAVSGAVIPVLHLNGFKISSSTIYGTMSHEELLNLFTGFGYEVRFVEDMNDMHADMACSMEWAYNTIRSIQNAARKGTPIFKPRWPLLILCTPKGWTCPKEYHGTKLEGNCASHQIPLKDPKENPETFKVLEKWMRSYHPENLFNMDTGAVREDILKLLPPVHRRMGMNAHTMPKFVPLSMPDMSKFQMVPKEGFNGATAASITKSVGHYLAEVIKMNPGRFRIFSPDELESNKLDAVLKVTKRNMQWLESSANKDGKVIEVLSEHCCEGWMEGYCLTGRFGIFPSYETFLGIIATMMIQMAKFIKLSTEDTNFRDRIPSINYLETSTLWGQEHNGYSHQDPMFINTLVNMKKTLVRIYLPPDVNTFLWTLEHCLNSKGYINLMIGSKKLMPVYLSPEEAREHCIAGASMWKWASTYDGVDPDVVLCGCGNETTVEVIAAATLLKKDLPQLRVRVVNVTDLMILDQTNGHPHALDYPAFNALFTPDKPVIFNFHGYPSVIHSLLFGRANTSRFVVGGYIEEGTTTTPFRMLTANRVSRYDVAIEALNAVSCNNPQVAPHCHKYISLYKQAIKEHLRYILKYGKDPEELSDILRDPVILSRHEE